MRHSIRFSCPPLLWFLATLAFVSLAYAGTTGVLPQTDDQPVGDQAVSTATTGDEAYEYTPIGDLPDWIVEFDSAADSDEYAKSRFLVSSDTYEYQREAVGEVWSNAEIEVHRYLEDHIAPGAGRALNVTRDYISENLTRQQHVHKFRTPNPYYEKDADEPEHLVFYRGWAELSLDDEFDQWAGARYEEHLVRSRILQTAVFVLSGITLLGIAYGFLHLNHRTRGFYSGRLQTITLVAVAVVVVVVLALSNSFEWL